VGGRGSGGARVGSGRKPKDKVMAFLHGSKPRETRVSRPQDVAMPSDLPADQSQVWRDLAPHAIEARTLTPATATAFRQLCGRIVLLRQMEALIAEDGLMGTKVSLQMDEAGGGMQNVEKKAHDLLTKCMTLMQRVDQGMIRFRLSPIGKEMTVETPTVDPFSEFDDAGSVQ
jgi:hypothetical protein